MKVRFLLILFFTIGIVGYSQQIVPDHSLKNVQFDIYGRVILDENNNKIEYSQSDLDLQLVDTNNSQIQNVVLDTILYTGDKNCQPFWKYSIMGTCIGRRSINTIDIDNDGVVEIICSGQPSGSYGGSWGFWYVLKYNTLTTQYEQNWVSDVYESHIRRIIINDFNSDGVLEIFVGYANGKVKIYDGISKNLIGQISIPGSNAINDIQICDADNDGVNEITVSNSSNIFLFNSNNLTLKSQIPHGCFDFRVGNVDNDLQLEIVTSNGKVIKYNGITDSVAWIYDSSAIGNMINKLEISDIDNDGLEEIIVAKTWNYVNVYDADTKTLKYSHYDNSDINTLLVKDVNNDNIDEIIYGEGQWGYVRCLNAVTNTITWQINNPEHGVTGIDIADVNNDGTLEVVWGAGWTSSGGDYLFVADIVTHNVEWTSIAIDGPFYGVVVSDVDNDGVEEIVTISYESDSGYNSGIITIFNSITHAIEWQCNGNFLEDVWTGIYGLDVIDIDNDNVKEIVVAAGDTYDGKIWIINGITKLIESSNEFNLTEFVTSNTIDIDLDGQIEIIAGNYFGIYVINPSNYAIEWGTTISNWSYNNFKVFSGNVDNDINPEIIVATGYIYIIDGITHQQIQSTDNIYTNLDICDINYDGVDEIIAGTYNGFIKILDGNTLQVIETFDVINSSIDGIKAADLNGDSIYEYVFTSNGVVYFTDLFKVEPTQRFDANAGKQRSIAIYDIDNDGYKEVFIGTNNLIVEIHSDCYSCLWYKIDSIVSQVSCGNIYDGSIQINNINGVGPYSYTWSTGSNDAILDSLPIGTYFVTVTDGRGCIAKDTILLEQAQLVTDFNYTNVSCTDTSDAIINVTIIEGLSPFFVNWNTMDTTFLISNLDTGIYYYTVIDAKNCISSDTITIVKDTIMIETFLTDITCFGFSNGSIATHVLEGDQPFSFVWSTGETSDSISALFPGIYSVTVTNPMGCYTEHNDTVFEPSQILTNLSSIPDNIVTSTGEGAATIDVIGGVPPYSILWDDPLQQSGNIAINLNFGMIHVSVVDSNLCQKLDSIIIDSYQGFENIDKNISVLLYPNPTNGIVNIEIKDQNVYDVTIQIYNNEGKLLYPKQTLDPTIINKIDISNFVSGVYRIILIANNVKYEKTILLIK